MDSNSFGTRFGVGGRKCRQNGFFHFFEMFNRIPSADFRHDVKWTNDALITCLWMLYNGLKQEADYPCHEFPSYFLPF